MGYRGKLVSKKERERDQQSSQREVSRLKKKKLSMMETLDKIITD